MPCETNTREAFYVFYDKALTTLDNSYPVHSITLSNGDPYFIMPHIKAFLRHRNRLMCRSEVAAANSLTFRIGKRIAAHNRIVFADTPRGAEKCGK